MPETSGLGNLVSSLRRKWPSAVNYVNLPECRFRSCSALTNTTDLDPVKQKKADVIGLRKSSRGAKPHPFPRRPPPPSSSHFGHSMSVVTLILECCRIGGKRLRRVCVITTNFGKAVMIHSFTVIFIFIFFFPVLGEGGAGDEAKKRGKGGREEKKTQPHTHARTHRHTKVSLQSKAQRKPVTPPDSF